MIAHEEITLELARLHRRAIEAVRQRNAAQQLGEAWQGIHEHVINSHVDNQHERA